MKPSTYIYEFKNGKITISRGVVTKFDWFAKVELTDEGYTKRHITLDQNLFLTKKNALETTKKLLSKYNLL